MLGSSENHPLKKVTWGGAYGLLGQEKKQSKICSNNNTTTKIVDEFMLDSKGKISQVTLFLVITFYQGFAWPPNWSANTS